MSGALGNFVWFDLMTTDVEAAKAFYSEIIGWKSTSFPGSDYEMWEAGERGVGGVMRIPADARAKGVGPHWLGYIATSAVDATVEKAQKLGGKVLVTPTEIPNTGRFAVLADPQGAAFAIYKSASESPAPEPRTPGHFGWAELNTTDWKSAWKFYSELFGWKEQGSMDMGGDLGEYFMFGIEPEQMIGGMSNTAKMMNAPAHWLHYTHVKDIDEAVKAIPQKGGKVLNGPMEVPGGDRVAQCQDPQGGTFAIFAAGPKQ